MRRALSLVADSPAADVSLADLAAAAGLSQYRLVEAFRQRFGTTPHAFQVAQRVNRSRRLLEAGVPAAEAAVRAGFLRPEPSAPALPPPAGPDPAAYTAAFGHRHHDFVQEPSGGRALTSDS